MVFLIVEARVARAEWNLEKLKFDLCALRIVQLIYYRKDERG